MSAYIKLIGTPLCPFTQRCRFVLEAGNLTYQYENIDLNHKPDWFLNLSPSGKVPLLKLEHNQAISESCAIMEYLADVFPETPKHPVDPLLRAQHRSWISFIDTIHSQLSWNLQQPTFGSNLTTKVNLSKIGDLCRKLASGRTGPYYSGKKLSLIDAAAAPLFIQLNWLRQRNSELNIFADQPALKEWSHALMNTVPVMKIYDGELNRLFMASLPDNIDSLVV